MVRKVRKSPVAKNEEVVDYSSTKSLETLCSADDIISRMKYDNTLIFNDLRKGIISVDKFLPIDPFCLSKMGWGERPYVNKNSCIGCEMLRRISPSIRVPENKIIDIEDNSVLIAKDVIPVSRANRPELMKRLNLL